MRVVNLLSAATASLAFVIPDEQTAQSLRIQTPEGPPTPIWSHASQIWDDAYAKLTETKNTAWSKLEGVAEDFATSIDDTFETAFAGETWLSSQEQEDDLLERPPHRKPHHGRPHDPHHGRPNLTVYELIANSKYTTKLAKAINEYPDLVESLNGTKANFTVFAPIDSAFDKIPKHGPKPSKEFIKELLSYHVSPEFYPAGRVLVTRTIPTIVEARHIKGVPQRLSTQIGFRGLTVNFRSRVVAVNIFGTNGVIHGIDSILIPPPKTITIINAFPGYFSTLELALLKTGLDKIMNDSSSHNGGTFFAPTNAAFQTLGPRVNAFLFSQYGLKYLKALLLYHTVDNITLYSDAIYRTKSSGQNSIGDRIPKGVYHIDLPTSLENRSLSVDIGRYGRLITIKINGFNRVVRSDGPASDGVIHTVARVLIPPKEPGEKAIVTDENTTVEEIIEALSPFVEDGAPFENEDNINFEL